MTDPDTSPSASRNRWLYLMLIGLVLASGLLWRSRYLHLPPFMSKYGGDALWALLVFVGFGFLFPRISTLRLTLIAIGLAWAVEFSQLYHTAWLDMVRATRIGHLVLGSTFNWPDLPAYVLGVVIGTLAEHTCLRRFCQRYS